MACITVADNGPGIPEADRESVFTEGKTLPGSDGTGFGLYLVDTLIEQYGGRVTISDAETLGELPSRSVSRSPSQTSTEASTRSCGWLLDTG